jgi:hypothetical protein
MAWARATREPSQGGVRDSPPAWHDERQLAGWQSGLRLTRSNVPAAWLLATRWDIVLSGIGLSPAGRFVSRPTQHSAGQHLGYGVTFAPPVPCRRMPARPDVWAGGQEARQTRREPACGTPRCQRHVRTPETLRSPLCASVIPCHPLARGTCWPRTVTEVLAASGTSATWRESIVATRRCRPTGYWRAHAQSVQIDLAAASRVGASTA